VKERPSAKGTGSSPGILEVPMERKAFVTKAAMLGASAIALGAAGNELAEAISPRRAAADTTSGGTSSGPLVLKPGPFPQTEEAKIAHLLRRAGFGATRQELETYLNMGLQNTIVDLLNYDQVNDGELEAKLQLYFAPPPEGTKPLAQNDLNEFVGQQRWWFLRMIYSKRPLQEKMTFFWHGLLTSGFSRVGQGPFMIEQNQLLRKHALGSYDVLLKAISRDYSMLTWLDSRNNRKDRPNENYARELMELFSMGVGNYTEQDVREAAKAFTGWTISGGQFVFNIGQHDFDVKTFLGRRGTFDGDDIIDIILQQRACHEYICRRLFRFFVYDDPEPQVIRRLADAFKSYNFSIREVMREIFMSPEFYSDRAYRAKVKSPVEFVAGAIRSLGLPTDGNTLGSVATAMGQALFNPPNVAGWPGGEVWINSSALLQRVNYAHRLTQTIKREVPRITSSITPPRGVTTRDAVAGFFGKVLLDRNLPPGHAEAIADYMKAFPNASQDADVLADVMYLMLASPEYQLA